jgi:hypothetical protein
MDHKTFGSPIIKISCTGSSSHYMASHGNGFPRLRETPSMKVASMRKMEEATRNRAFLSKQPAWKLGTYATRNEKDVARSPY